MTPSSTPSHRSLQPIVRVLTTGGTKATPCPLAYATPRTTTRLSRGGASATHGQLLCRGTAPNRHAIRTTGLRGSSIDRRRYQLERQGE